MVEHSPCKRAVAGSIPRPVLQSKKIMSTSSNDTLVKRDVTPSEKNDGEAASKRN